MFLFGKVLDNSWGPLYLLLLDRAGGSGMVDVSIDELSNTLRRSRRSINRYLANAIPFRAVIRRVASTSNTRTVASTIRVFIRSLRDVRERIGGSLGPRFEGDIECLLKPKYYATLSYALSLQSLALVAIGFACKDRDAQPQAMKLPETFFTKEGVPSPDTKGSLHVSTKGNVPRVFMGSDYTHAGASLEGISKRMGRSVSTLQRYLRHSKKVRVLHYHPSYYVHAREAEFLDNEEGGNESGLYYRYKGMYFKGMTNVYYPELSLCGGDRGARV